MKPPRSVKELDDLIATPPDIVAQTVADTPGRFAVLGAGGKMGFHVSCMVKRALEAVGRSEPVITVSRFGSKQKRKQFADSGFDVHIADLSEPQDVDQLPDAENVFFLAGIKFGTSGNPKLLKRMNVEMPRLVADRYRNSRIVALSTGCVYEYVKPSSGGSTETSSTSAPGVYAQSCLGREQSFVENSEQHGTATSLIRLNYSIELRYGVLVDIAQKVMKGDAVSLDTGYVNVIWQGDAVAHVIQSLPHATNPPLVLNVTGTEILRVQDLAEMFGERFGNSPKFVGESNETAWLSNASLSHRMFGTPSVSVEQMVDWIAGWIKNGGETLNMPTRFEVRNGNY